MTIAYLNQPPPERVVPPDLYEKLVTFRRLPTLYHWSIISPSRIGNYTLSQAAQLTGSGIPPTPLDFDRLTFWLIH